MSQLTRVMPRPLQHPVSNAIGRVHHSRLRPGFEAHGTPLFGTTVWVTFLVKQSRNSLSGRYEPEGDTLVSLSCNAVVIAR